LLLFLGAAVTLQWWLHRETRQLQAVAVEEMRTRLVRAVAATARPPTQWDAAQLKEFGAWLGGTVELFSATPPPDDSPAGPLLTVSQTLAGTPGWQARVTFAPPGLLRVQILQQRVLAAMILLALLLALVPLLLVSLSHRQTVTADNAGQTPWATVRAQAAGMVHFAKISNERGTALEQEHGARVRAEEDLQVNRTLLGQSVAERVRLGRELHDNICQTLFAVCLTLESVQKRAALPAELQQRMNQCMTELRRLNQQVRAYLEELEPAHVTSQSFSGALNDLVGSFASSQNVRIEQRLDPEAVARIAPVHLAEIMNILREALSNSLRHGRAGHITLLAGHNDGEVALAVQDDGQGFNPVAGGSAGHGLGNMQARASALGGSLRIESAVGKGTRVLLTLPVASPV
jgi:signal transduction histidine kinase